jgi:hypothetical protein
MACDGCNGNADSPATAASSGAGASAAPVGASAAPASGGTTAAGGAGASAASSASPATGGASSAASAAPAQRPFASSPLEAQTLIQGEIDKHITSLWKCVADYRQKKNDPHRPIVVDIGIDQEGTLLGVVSPNPKKGDLDPALRDCLRESLHGLPFPKSHAGVITVRQTFTDVMTQ